MLIHTITHEVPLHLPLPETWRGPLPTCRQPLNIMSDKARTPRVTKWRVWKQADSLRRTDDVSHSPRQHKRIFDYFLSSTTSEPPLLWEAETAAATKLCYTVSERSVSISSCLSSYPCVFRICRVFKMEKSCRPDHTGRFPRNMPSYSSGVWTRYAASVLGQFLLLTFFFRALRQDLVGILTSPWNAVKVHSAGSELVSFLP